MALRATLPFETSATAIRSPACALKGRDSCVGNVVAKLGFSGGKQRSGGCIRARSSGGGKNEPEVQVAGLNLYIIQLQCSGERRRGTVTGKKMTNGTLRIEIGLPLEEDQGISNVTYELVPQKQQLEAESHRASDLALSDAPRSERNSGKPLRRGDIRWFRDLLE